MNFQDELLLGLANREFKRITTNTIRNMQGYRDSLLSGEDTNLKNAWDEICVQVQGDRSFFWDAYLDLIEKYVSFEVESLPNEMQMTLWVRTQNGYGWDAELDEDPENVVFDVVQHVIHEHVLFEAGNWSNERIRHFLEESGRRD